MNGNICGVFMHAEDGDGGSSENEKQILLRQNRIDEETFES
jgi:hypothetical protein